MVIGLFSRFCFRLRKSSFHKIINDGATTSLKRRSLVNGMYEVVFFFIVFSSLHTSGETAVHITIVNGDLLSFKLLVGQYGADVHARARGRFFMPEDCKDRMKQETNYDGEWSKASHFSDSS